MDRWKREGLRSANNGLRNQIENLMEAYALRRPDVVEAFRELEVFRLQSASADHSVEVTVDASGVLTDLTLATSALGKTPDELGRIVADTTQEAARRARERAVELLASIAADLEGLPDLTDIMADATELRDISALFPDGGKGATDGAGP